ncbi:hypothetical protein ACLOJK_038351 [Asimina triloba]
MAPGLRPWLNIFEALLTVVEWNLSTPIISKTELTEGFICFHTCSHPRGESAGLALRWDIWGVPERWCESVRYVVVEKGKKRAPKRARSLEEGSILVGSDSSAEDVSKLSPLGGTSLAIDSGDRRIVVLTQESIARSG